MARDRTLYSTKYHLYPGVLKIKHHSNPYNMFHVFFSNSATVLQYANCNWVCAQGNTTKGDGGWPISWSDIGLYQPKLPHEMGGRVHSRFHYHYFPPMEGRIYRGRERASCMNQCCWMLVLVVYTPVGNGVYVCTGT